MLRVHEFVVVLDTSIQHCEDVEVDVIVSPPLTVRGVIQPPGAIGHHHVQVWILSLKDNVVIENVLGEVNQIPLGGLPGLRLTE